MPRRPYPQRPRALHSSLNHVPSHDPIVQQNLCQLRPGCLQVIVHGRSISQIESSAALTCRKSEEGDKVSMVRMKRLWAWISFLSNQVAWLSSRCRAADLGAHDTVLWTHMNWRSWPRYDLTTIIRSLPTTLSGVGYLRRTVMSPPSRPGIPRLLPTWLESPACNITRSLSLYFLGSSPEIIRNCCCPSTALATSLNLQLSVSVTGNLVRSIALRGSSSACPDESNAVKSQLSG